jgi:hypothetical protein
MRKHESKWILTCDRCKRDTDHLQSVYKEQAMFAHRVDEFHLLSDLCRDCWFELQLFLKKEYIEI